MFQLSLRVKKYMMIILNYKENFLFYLEHFHLSLIRIILT